MLVRITNRCRMGCSHCMVDAVPDGAHMDMGIFRATADFIERFGLKVAMLSGGEPTEHPDLFAMVDHARARGLHVLVLSNGDFPGDVAKGLRDREVAVQVTNDDRFYPRRVPKPDLPGVSYETRIRMVSPFGRAVANSLECNRSSPLCFNLRSLCRHYGSFEAAIVHLRGAGKFCTPSVNVDGSVVAGEAPSCSPIGTVNDSERELTGRVCGLRCGRCGLTEGLSGQHLRAIGEAT